MEKNKSIYKKKTIIDIIRVTISNLVKLVSGVLVGLLLPKIIGVVDYGYYKTFTLYASYVGIFHFGIADGIYLKYGGMDYSELEKTKFRFYSRFFIIFEIVISIILASVSTLFLQGEMRLIFLCVAIYLLFHNIAGYYQSISQSVGRFKEFSKRTIIQSVLTALAVIILWLMDVFSKQDVSYKMYLNMYLVISIALAIWYVFTYKDILIGKYEKKTELWKEIIYFIKIGFPLMLANLCSTLVLTLGRQFVNLFFDKVTYAIYAFAYNMLSLVTIATTAISTVLYANLKRLEEKKLRRAYTQLNSVVLILVFGCLVVYFPLSEFVGFFLEMYVESLVIFRVIFPGLALTSSITIVMHNYYKTLGKNNVFFVKSVITLCGAVILNSCMYILFKSPLAISIASVVTMLFWYILSESFFIRVYRVEWKRNFIYIVVMTTLFYVISICDELLLGGIMYIIVFGIITAIMYKKDILKILNALRNNRKEE